MIQNWYHGSAPTLFLGFQICEFSMFVKSVKTKFWKQEKNAFTKGSTKHFNDHNIQMHLQKDQPNILMIIVSKWIMFDSLYFS